jgi:hypothetical protein
VNAVADVEESAVLDSADGAVAEDVDVDVKIEVM